MCAVYDIVTSKILATSAMFEFVAVATSAIFEFVAVMRIQKVENDKVLFNHMMMCRRINVPSCSYPNVTSYDPNWVTMSLFLLILI